MPEQLEKSLLAKFHLSFVTPKMEDLKKNCACAVLADISLVIFPPSACHELAWK
jgi:hypothetical protein